MTEETEVTKSEMVLWVGIILAIVLLVGVYGYQDHQRNLRAEEGLSTVSTSEPYPPGVK